MVKVGNPPIPTQVPNLTAPTGLADHKEWMGKSKGGDRHCVPVAQVSCPQRGQLCHAVVGLEVVVDLVLDQEVFESPDMHKTPGPPHPRGILVVKGGQPQELLGRQVENQLPAVHKERSRVFKREEVERISRIVHYALLAKGALKQKYMFYIFSFIQPSLDTWNKTTQDPVSFTELLCVATCSGTTSKSFIPKSKTLKKGKSTKIYKVC